MCASGAAAPRFELPRTRRRNRTHPFRTLRTPQLPRPAAHSPCTRTNGENTTQQPVYPGADPYLRHFSARSRVTVLRATHPRNLSLCDNNTPQTTPRRAHTSPSTTRYPSRTPRTTALSELSPKRGISAQFSPVFRVFGDSSAQFPRYQQHAQTRPRA